MKVKPPLVSLMKNILLFSLLIIPTIGKSAFHLWDIAEIYSSDDGSVQFIELVCDVNNQQFLSGHDLFADSDGNVVTFTFPSNSGSPTADKRLLIATASFASLPGAVTPDFTLPDNFFNPTATAIQINFGPNSHIVNFSGSDVPSDGMSSIDDNLVSAVNSPTNFAGDTGSIFVEPDFIFASGFEAD